MDYSEAFVSERLLFRPCREQDFEGFWELLTDPVGKRYTGGVTRMGHDERRALFLKDIAVPFGMDGAEYAVIERESGKYLGYCGFRMSDEVNGPEFLYGYRRECWGKGYGFEAARAVLDRLCALYPHRAYFASVEDGNAASSRILTKLGFVQTDRDEYEGTAYTRYRLDVKDKGK